MRRALHLLVIVTVLMCGLHVGESAEAHAGVEQHQPFSVFDAPSAKDEGSDRGNTKAAHASHHHCPMAADLADHEARRRDPLRPTDRSDEVAVSGTTCGTSSRLKPTVAPGLEGPRCRVSVRELPKCH
jgi:hypothetical protein